MSITKELCKKYNNIIDELKNEGIINNYEAELLQQRSVFICTININKEGKIANMDEFLQNIDNCNTEKSRKFFKDNNINLK